MAKDRQLPSLPEPVQEALAELRTLQPSEGFYDQLTTRLQTVDTAQLKQTTRSTHKTWLHAALPFIPALAAAGVVLYVGLHNAPQELEKTLEAEYRQRMEERSLDLPSTGHGWLHLDLWTHHHDDTEATLVVQAPKSVQVLATNAKTKALTPPVCTQESCVHRFTHSPSVLPSTPVRLGIANPGQYRIRVEHHSDELRIQEHFLVHAQR